MIFAHSHFSFLRGASSPNELAEQAAALGHTALCLTDVNGVYGAVELQKACRKLGLKQLIGCTVDVGGLWLRIIARNADGYASMNAVLTTLHSQEEARFTSLSPLSALHDCIIILPPNILHSNILHSSFRECDVYCGLDHQRKPGDGRRATLLVREARARNIPVCVAPFVHYATRDDYVTYDVMTCTRLGITIFDPHPERPVNDEACLRSEEELRALLPYDEAFANTHRIIEQCSFNILPGHVTPPSARLPEGTTPEELLTELCTAAIPRKYNEQESKSARELLARELDVICPLGLADFFLVVKEIIDESRRRGILCSGRGSAANSIVAYLLDITGVCPIQHNLLFERFLHRGRKGTPDIDVDFDSDRRNEIITWMEKRFGIEQTAMTATLITYRTRMAVRDAAKALGWPMETVNKMSKAVPAFTDTAAEQLRGIIDEVPMLDVLIRVVSKLLDHPRHLGLHSGGMILSSKPLNHFTPVQRSANGVPVVQFSKDDVEAMGLVKFDVLGLRMLACISEALELIQCTEGKDLKHFLDTIPLDDKEVFDFIKGGETLGIFQIESQGQMHLLAQHQPECFNDLVTEVALFRPGPLQGGMVNPYVRRRRGKEPVVYMHPNLEPLLKDTLGIIVFQEQVLEVAHHFAGMPLDEADDFRSLVSKNRDPIAMAAMKEKFVKGAVSRGVDEYSAEQVYEKLSHFVGYGFCRSHAAAFAKIVYQSAWLKLHYPAAYMAAFMQHRPGLYSLMTLEEEARRFGVPTLLPDINLSGTRYSLEQHSVLSIRKPLTAIKNVSEDTARLIIWERARQPFTSAEDFVRRVPLSSDLYDNIALSGALDTLEGDSRRALWIVGLLRENPRSRKAEKPRSRKSEKPKIRKAERLNSKVSGISDSRILGFSVSRIFDESISRILIPELPTIKAKERLAYDYITHGSARTHPMALYRRTLNDLEVRTIETAWSIVNPQTQSLVESQWPVLTVAGIVILRQSPRTANGVLFVTIEDETGFIQCVVKPQERDRFAKELRHAAVIVKAQVASVKSEKPIGKGWRGLLVRDVHILNNVIGGYHGHLSMYGGLDTMELSTLESSAPDPLISKATS